MVSLENQPTEATIDRIGAGNTVADLIQDLLQGVWYLAIDVGTTGISAVLLEQLSGQLYPVYWSDTATSDATTSDATTAAIDRRFRLPAVVSLVTEVNQTSRPVRSLDRRFAVPLPFTQLADPVSISAFTNFATEDAPSLFIQDIKPYLRLGIPYQTQTQQWEPVLQKTDSQQMPLIWMQQALQALLSSLKQSGLSASDAPSSSFLPSPLVCGALDMEASAFQRAIDQLAGVVIGYPSNWSDTYSFNLREAVLATQLVDRPEQIFLIEDTIAALLSVLRQEGAKAAGQVQQAGKEVILHNADWQGTTLILNAGATVTELALVHLPEQPQDLHYSDFQIRSMPFAGNAIDQDIVCYLLYPLLQKLQATNKASVGSNRVDLQLDAVYLDSLRLEQLVLPIAGEPDLPNRYRLRQRLENSRSGQILLDAARRLKLAFQQQSRFTLQLGDRHLTILRQDLGSRVLLPYVQRLNRELNTLLQQTFTATEAVNQIICTGGTASIRAIGRWLHEKFPNATIIQDTYTQAISSIDYCLPSCSRVAYGLAALPLYPQVLDSTRHQYNDYLLLRTLLRSLPDHAISFDEIMQILSQQGIEAHIEQVRSHVLALLEGHLPPGLIPSEQDTILFSNESLRNADIKAIQVAPFCQHQGDYYRLNRYQWGLLQHCLEMVLSHTQQQLDQPYSTAQLKQYRQHRQ